MRRGSASQLAQYKCYLLNRDNHIIRREDVEVEELARAIEQGYALIEQSRERFDGFEIWQGAERLHAFKRSNI
ncbi:MAG TPA: hypothetical protein VEU53_13945 [Stellaceae bacterium]|nr:hypothetical protein [Stellaceae bacterium]